MNMAVLGHFCKRLRLSSYCFMHYTESVIHLQFPWVKLLSKTVCPGHEICAFCNNRSSIKHERERYRAEMAAALKKDLSGDVSLAIGSPF